MALKMIAHVIINEMFVIIIIFNLAFVMTYSFNMAFVMTNIFNMVFCYDCLGRISYGIFNDCLDWINCVPGSYW